MKSLKHPNFILAIVAILVFFIGVGLKANGYQSSDYAIGGGIVLGAIHYVWSIIDVATTHTLQAVQKKFWLIIVIVAPGFGSILYYIMHSRRNQVV